MLRDLSHPAEATEVIQATITDYMVLEQLEDKNNFAETTSGSETLVSDFSSNDHEQQRNEAEVSSRKKKVRIKYIV